MQKKTLAITVFTVLVLGAFSAVCLFEPTQAASLDMKINCGGTVDKNPGESFSVNVTFKNKGTATGVWKIAVSFEGDDWTWTGKENLLSLKPRQTKTLTWEGNVMEGAEVDTVARLIVYVDDGFVPLNWWIHVTPKPDLCIVNSHVS